MRVLVAAVAICACAAVLVGAAILVLAIDLLPYVAVGCAVGLLIRSCRRGNGVAVRKQAYRHIPLPPARQYRAPAGQWVYVPVWVGAPQRPAMPVIDAEVIGERR
jgi:hypothetical protein